VITVVVSIQGPSGSGKTTLIEQVIARLRAHGLSVGVMKHAHEGFTLDRRGKDSQRFWASGAQAVLIAGPDELFIRQRHASNDLAELLSLLPPGLDCVLIEGFTQQVAALDVAPSVRVHITPAAVRLNGQPVEREEAAAALEQAVGRCLSRNLAALG
jgi:molybdopterin-guanine dinucleotide biosynthesis protein MobB